jgi:hypothetical protein
MLAQIARRIRDLETDSPTFVQVSAMVFKKASDPNGARSWGKRKELVRKSLDNRNRGLYFTI